MPAASSRLPFSSSLFNFLILFGPLVVMGISRSRPTSPATRTGASSSHDVRGQAEAKEEIRRVVSLWQSGEAFEKAGGKRERGVLFLGAPGTGKTMLSKAIATGFNCPFVSIPGSGFAQTFIGMDAVIVRYLAWQGEEARRASGAASASSSSTRSTPSACAAPALGGGVAGAVGRRLDPRPLFYGPNGALNAERRPGPRDARVARALFAQRAPEPRSPYPPSCSGSAALVNQVMFPGHDGRRRRRRSRSTSCSS